MRHLYVDVLSRKNSKGGRTAGRGRAISKELKIEPNIVICHDCGKAEHYRGGYAATSKACGTSNKPAG